MGGRRRERGGERGRESGYCLIKQKGIGTMALQPLTEYSKSRDPFSLLYHSAIADSVTSTTRIVVPFHCRRDMSKKRPQCCITTYIIH